MEVPDRRRCSNSIYSSSVNTNGTHWNIYQSSNKETNMKKIVIVKKGVTTKEVAQSDACCSDGSPGKVR